MGPDTEKGLKLIVASNNPKKVGEMKTLLAPYFNDVVSLKEAGVDVDIPETGDTFIENAMIKAAGITRITRCAAVSDDSGLCVEALRGGPGVYSARYGGENLDDAGRTSLLLEEMRDVPADKRGAYFESAVVLTRPDAEPVVAGGRCYGRIGFEPAGENGFGYDPVFIPDGYGETFAQMDPEEKNRISHRYRALEALIGQLG
ncbi:MAG: RdgB/HAM1 family non-canonical purine NTP pyrophosphatase [Christensenellales bacterium]|jgi:XTP/dITP diphosphohydrolase